MESDQKHLTVLTNIPPKSTSPETSSSESSSSEFSLLSETSSSKLSSSESSSSSETSSSESRTPELSSFETSSSETSSSNSDIDEIVNMIKHQRIRERLARRKDQEKNAHNKKSCLKLIGTEQ